MIRPYHLTILSLLILSSPLFGLSINQLVNLPHIIMGTLTHQK